jgi:hypothetical protein
MIDFDQSIQSQRQQRQRKGRRGRFAELGPAWITALATLIVALTGAGFFVGRASVTSSPVTSPSGTIPKTVSAAPPTQTGGSAAPTPQSGSASIAANGAQLGSYSFQLTNGYTAPLGPTAPTQSQILAATSDGSYDISFNGEVTPGDNEKMISLPEGSTPTYSACTSGTVFEQYATPLAQGTVFCVTETTGDVAGVTITSVGGSPLSSVFKVTLWKGGS